LESLLRAGSRSTSCQQTKAQRKGEKIERCKEKYEVHSWQNWKSDIERKGEDYTCAASLGIDARMSNAGQSPKETLLLP
jgi:hypothetical protein